jgi:hypothetical protein
MNPSARSVFVSLGVVLLMLLGACSSDGSETQDSSAQPVEPVLTPLIVGEGPDVFPVRGADGRYHILWEVPVQNASSLDLTVSGISVTGDDGTEVLALDADGAAEVVQVLGTREADPMIGSAQSAYLFLTTSFDSADDLPSSLTHEVSVAAEVFPEPIVVSGGTVLVDIDGVVPLLSTPLQPGSGYVVGDGCCQSELHIRSGLPINNGYWFAQRFAIDWEQIDDSGRFSVGDTSEPTSYAIYGNDLLAADDGTIISAVDRFEDQEPGALPEGVSLPDSDGNHVVIDIGDGLFLLYAHLAPGSVAVEAGDKVSRGDVIGMVGNTGNTLAPHLHFHVMDGPSPLVSNGRPYMLESFEVEGQAESTEAFAAAETTGEVLSTLSVDGEPKRSDELPLDLQIVTFAEPS